MAQNEHDSLCALEQLMEEFFSSNTNNIKKQEIELQLNAFSSQYESWKHCIYFLNNTSSQYVSMFALSTIESVIHRQWTNLEWEHREQLKTALHSYIIKNNATCPNFLRNKIAKLFVDIARFDWPKFYPEYITNIIRFLQSDQEQLLGLVLLKTTSEELISNRAEISSTRKEELQCLLSQHIPQIFFLLTKILENLSSRPRHSVTATPPPSPTHPSLTPELTPQLSVATFRPDSREITREALATLQHIFSWVNLAQITPYLIREVFHFTNASSYAQDDDDMCVLAMSAINELLYRKSTPPGTQNLFIELYHYAVQLLKDITCPSTGRMETLGTDFIDKLTEFLSLLVSQHLWRLEANNQFSALDFLSLLYQCTFQQTSIDSYLGCLDVWRVFMKQLKREHFCKYTDALTSLVKEVLIKMQFIHNHNQLESLNTDVIDNDNETEWQHFLKECIEIIAVVAEIIPTTFNLLLVPWRNANELYNMIENAVDCTSHELKVETGEVQRVHCILRDLSTLTQALARLSSIFSDQNSDLNAESILDVDPLIKELLQTALYATKMRFDHLQVTEKKLNEDFIEVHAQLLAGLKTWYLWLVVNKRDPVNQIGDVVTVTTSILLNGYQETPKLTLPAAHLLLSITNITFPPNIIAFPPVIELLHTAPIIKYQDEHTLNVLHQAMVNLLVRPWGDLIEADKNQRDLLIKMFFDMLTKNFRNLVPSTNQATVQEVVLSTLPYLSRIIEYCKHHASYSKKLIYSGIQSTIQHALVLFPKYANCPEVSNTILELFLIVLDVLQQQMGLEFTKMAVEVFLDVAVSDQQSHKLCGLDKLLHILQIVVEGPGQMYKSFLPGIITLCMDHVYPLVVYQPNQHPDVVSALLSLLHSIMLHRWQYFYISQVRLGYSPGTSDASGASETESLHNHEQLLSILQAFGLALLQPDINIFRLSLASLEHLNNKWRLYHKGLFKKHLLSQFLTVLLQNLLHKSHALLNEDIILAIYNMSSVDFYAFFNTFLPHFLQSVDGLDQRQRQLLQSNFIHDTDMPSFIQNVHRFVSDVRCYRVCSDSSLFLGNVVL